MRKMRVFFNFVAERTVFQVPRRRRAGIAAKLGELALQSDKNRKIKVRRRLFDPVRFRAVYARNIRAATLA